MEVLNDLLSYPLKIYQNDDWFKFSLDSVLLAEFINIKKSTKKILDLGTGNAPIPLILSTKTSCSIIGVELQTDVSILATKSILYNHLEKQITILNDDMKLFCKNMESDQFDIITSNPPYFKYQGSSYLNVDEHKVIARHEKMIQLEEIVKIARKLLKNKGSFYMVHRPDRFIEIIQLFKNANLEPKRIQFCYTNDMNATLFLIEGVKNGQIGLKIEPPLYI